VSQPPTNNPDRVRVRLGKRSYDIAIHPGGLKQLGQYLQDLGYAGKVGIITNSIVQSLYGRTVSQSLKRAGYQCHVICIPDGSLGLAHP